MAAAATDLLIIGGGPAGLSAMNMFARTLRPVMLYDSQQYRNAAARESHTVMGFDGRDPADFRAAVRRDLERYRNAEIRTGKITSLRRVAGGSIGDVTKTSFEATDSDGRVVRARKVVLATGVRDVLPSIPGLQEHWGTRAIHCIFCHGTETAGSPMGFLLASRAPAANAAVVGNALTMWAAIPHAKKYILTNGVDPAVGEEDVTGLRKYLGVIKARGHEIISSHITRIDTLPSGDMSLVFADRDPLVLPYMMVSPESIEPSADARPLLTPSLLGHADLGPMGALPPPPADAHPAHMPPRAGADPRTPLRGLFWAGNAGSPTANVAMSCAQGQLAGVVAADEVAGEDLEADVEKTKK